MQQPDSAPDAAAAAARQMAHPALLLLPRTGGGSLDDPPPASPPAAAPGSLGVGVAGGSQLKKKSGFQITSVTAAAAAAAAQLSGGPSGGNSAADDTESYDELDESRTEELSSSDLLDASLSRATGPERSSSEETLSNFHEADASPPALSPNQPHLNGGAHPHGPFHPPRPAPARAPTPSSNGPAAAASRFRVVKLDSGSEPLRKGRWTCTDFYDKEGPPPAPPDARRAPPPDGSPAGGSSLGSGPSPRNPRPDSAEGAAPQPAGLPHSRSQGQLPPEAAGPPPGSALPQQLPYAQPPTLQRLHGPGQAPPGPGHMAPALANAAKPGALPGADYGQQQHVRQAPLPSGQPSGPAHLAAACAPTPMPAAAAGMPMMNPPPPGTSLPPVVQQPLLAGQMAPSQVGPPVPTGMIPPGAQAGPSSLPQLLGLAPQTPLLAAQAQLQPGEPLVPGMAGQQVPALSPGPAVGAVPVSGHCAANVPPPVGLAPSKNAAPSSGVQNDCLAQKLPQPSPSTSIHLPQNAPALNSAQFSAQSLAQSSAARGEEARRCADALLMGMGQPLGLESGAGIPSGLLDGSGSMAASLFPLKGLPLTVQLMDGEDDGSSGASIVAIDNKIEQAMDLVKSHLMYAVREEVEVLKEQIKELVEKNSQLEQENSLLKTLASPEQLAQFQAQLQTSSSPTPSQPQGTGQPQPPLPGSGPSA